MLCLDFFIDGYVCREVGVPEIVTFLQEVSVYFLKVDGGQLKQERYEFLERDFAALVSKRIMLTTSCVASLCRTPSFSRLDTAVG